MSSSETVYMYSGIGQIRKWVTRNGEQLPPFWRWTSQMQKGERWRQVLGSDWDRQCQYELVLKMYVGGYRSRHRCARAYTHTLVPLLYLGDGLGAARLQEPQCITAHVLVSLASRYPAH